MKECTRCTYTDAMPNIVFDEEGVCNYCKQSDLFDETYPIGAEGRQRLEKLAEDIKKAGKGKQFDCAIGVSGGCDSSYLLHLMKELGLRPLAVHFDNTWNSAIATQNIKTMLDQLDIELFTLVVDNKEYDDLYRSFLLAGVPDIETPTDIGLATTMYIACEKYKIKYVIDGHSFRTEGITPLGHLYMDGKYIESVHKAYGKLPMKTFPNLWFHKFLKWMVFNRIKRVRPLYYIDYNKAEAKKFLQEKYGWQWYGGHHLENRFTAFYHSYFMPKRFKLDQRVNEVAALVRHGQMTKEEGKAMLAEAPFLEDGVFELVKKRLGFSDDEFEEVMNLPIKTYKDFKTYKQLFERLRPFFYVMQKLELVPKSFYEKYTIKHD